MATTDLAPGTYTNGPEESSRYYSAQELTLDGTTDITEAWDIRRFAMGHVSITTATVVATAFTFSVSTDGTTFRDAYDEGGVVVTLTLHAAQEAKFYTIPARIMEYGWIKFKSNGDEGGTSSALLVGGKS